MPITTSAKKALRASARKRRVNLRRSRILKKAMKEALRAPDKLSLSRAYQAIDKAAKRGLLKKNTAARKKARLARLLAGQAKLLKK